MGTWEGMFEDFLWQLWLAGGLLLIILEIVTATFVLIFLALGCFAERRRGGARPRLLRPARRVYGHVGPLAVWLARKAASENAVSHAASHQCRCPDRSRCHGTESIPATGQVGRVAIDGDVWPARAANGGDIESGTQVRVERIDGITLVVSRVGDASHSKK